ncbi:MAG: PAS domain-containing protein, partial [Candidatus Brocadiales bacterium]
MPRKILTRFGVNQFRWFILIALLPLTIAGTACYFFVRGQIRQDVFNELQVEAWGIKNNIASILGENLARIVDFSSDGYIRDSARALLLPVEKADIVRQNLNRHLEVNKRSLDPDIVEVFIVDTTGKIVASTSSSQIGKDISAKQYFVRPFLHFEQTGPVFSRETMPTNDVGEPDIVFSALLTDKHLHTPIGVIGNRISTDVLLNTITSVPNVSGNKEKSANHSHIHILNKDKFILATSGSKAGLHSKKVIGASVIERAFAENRSVIDTYKNPSGHWVLGVAVPVKETGWVILAERDYDVAFAPLARIRNLFIILNCSAALMAFLVAFFVSRNLSADIRKLKDGTETVARGDLDHKIELKRKDELKDLSISFNTMTGRLKEYTEQMARRGEEILESEKKYRTLVENLPQKIFYKDKNSVYVSCNDNYARDLKIKLDEIVGKTDYEFYQKELAEKYRADDRRIMASGETEDIEEKYVRDGKEYIVYTVKTPVRNEKGVTIGILGIFWDITRRKQMEEELKRTQKQLFQAEKMSSLGTLASGIAHEVNNPLSYTINNIELIKDYIGDIT